jgi:hypothetical protein
MRERFWTITGAPLWRDWFAGVFLIGLGWAVYNPQDRTSVKIEIVLASLGSLILLAEVCHRVHSLITGRMRNRPIK